MAASQTDLVKLNEIIMQLAQQVASVQAYQQANAPALVELAKMIKKAAEKEEKKAATKARKDSGVTSFPANVGAYFKKYEAVDPTKLPTCIQQLIAHVLNTDEVKAITDTAKRSTKAQQQVWKFITEYTKKNSTDKSAIAEEVRKYKAELQQRYELAKAAHQQQNPTVGVAEAARPPGLPQLPQLLNGIGQQLAGLTPPPTGTSVPAVATLMTQLKLGSEPQPVQFQPPQLSLPTLTALPASK